MNVKLVCYKMFVYEKKVYEKNNSFIFRDFLFGLLQNP